MTPKVFYYNVREYLESLSEDETPLERVLQVVFGTTYRKGILFSCRLLLDGVKDPEFEEIIPEILKSNLPRALTYARKLQNHQGGANGNSNPTSAVH